MSRQESKSDDRDSERDFAATLRSMFLADPSAEQLELLVAPCRHRLAEQLQRLLPGSYVGVVHRTERPATSARLLAFLLLPFRLTTSERRLRSAEVEPVGRFAVASSAGEPWLAYELGTPAARYAERHLVAGSLGASGMEFARRALGRWARCSPAVSAVVVLGRRP